MNLKTYELEADRYSEVFEFTSQGPKGDIAKLIRFTPIVNRDVYNLSFGDKNVVTGEMDDLAISNNSDSEQVLATVVLAVYRFTDFHKDAWVVAQGSSKSRTRLYRMGLTKHIQEIESEFFLLGLKNGAWEKFERGIEYDAFLVKRIELEFTI